MEEIGRLVTRMIADVSQYINPMKQAASTAEATSAIAAKASQSLEDTAKSINAVGSALQSSLSVLAFGGILGKAIDSFSKADERTFKLSARFRQMGVDVSGALAYVNQFASEVSAATGASRGQVSSLYQTALAYGKAGDAAETMVKQSIAYSRVGPKSFSPEHVMSMLARGTSGGGHFGLQMLLPQLKDYHDPATKAAKAQQLLNEMIELSKGYTDTLKGSLEVLKNSVGALTFRLGEAIGKGLVPFIKYGTEALNWVKSLPSYTFKVAAGFLSLVSILSTATVTFKLFKLILSSVFSPWIAMLTSVIKLASFANIVWATRTALWVFFLPVLLAVKAAMLAYTLVTTGAALITFVIANFVAILTAGMWLLIGSLVAVAGWFVVIAAAGAAWAALGAGMAVIVAHSQELYDSWNKMSGLKDKLIEVGNVLSEWGTILGNAIKATGTSVSLARDILVVGWELAVVQFKEMWPPLWASIVETTRPFRDALTKVFSDVAQVMYLVFVTKWRIALLDMEAYARKWMSRSPIMALAPSWMIQQDIDAIDAARGAAVRQLERDLIDQTAGLKAEVANAAKSAIAVSTEAGTADPKKRIEELRARLQELYGQMKSDVGPAIIKPFGQMAQGANEARKSIEALNFVLYGTAEAYYEIRKTTMGLQSSTGLGAAPGSIGPAGGGAPMSVSGPATNYATESTLQGVYERLGTVITKMGTAQNAGLRGST